nr:hypothetical protein [uncultured Rhodopila sp.]
MYWFEAVVNVIVLLISEFRTREVAFAFAFAILIVGLVGYIIMVFRPHHALVRAVRGATKAVQVAARESSTDEDKLAKLQKRLSKTPFSAPPGRHIEPDCAKTAEWTAAT